MNGVWTTVSSKTVHVPDANPQVWYDAAESAPSWEEALYLYEKGEFYHRIDIKGKYPVSKKYLKQKLYIKFHKTLCIIIGITAFVLVFLLYHNIVSSLNNLSLRRCLSQLAHVIGLPLEEVIFIAVVICFWVYEMYSTTSDLKPKERKNLIVGMMSLTALAIIFCVIKSKL